jgi:hypothetical protein
MTATYSQPTYFGKRALLEAINRDDVEALRPMIIAAALEEEDREFIEEAFAKLSVHGDEIVRGNATLAVGHIARIFGEVSTAGVEIVRRGLHDESSYVRGQANAAAGDLRHFVGIETR